ncbi:ABCC12 [Bugula neritina]|uniref:ABCC12 n=1 Tax=Bugula neritina TaxID=10212 RepID=A0A7J7J4Q4_BUGNE|nr:ABCC12 [Bugula neritina]
MSQRTYTPNGFLHQTIFSNRFEKLWKEEVKRKGLKGASVLFTVIRMVRGRMIVGALFGALLSAAIFFRSSYILQKLLTTIEISDTTSYGYQALLFSLIILCSVMKTLCYSALSTTASVAGIRARSGVLSFLFQKILRSQHHSVSTGELINLCASDGQRIYDAILVASMLFTAVPIIGVAVYSTYLLGYWGLLGLAVVLGSIPVKLRKKESKSLKNLLIAQSLMVTLSQMVPIFATALTLLAMTICKADFSLLRAFVYMSTIYSLRMALGTIPFCLRAISEAVNACFRLKDILVVEEQKLQVLPVKSKDKLLEINKASFGWKQDLLTCTDIKSKQTTKYGATYKERNEKRTEKDGESSEDRLLFAAEESDDAGDVVLTLHDITMSLCLGQLVGVCGAVGSGKSSLIQAILGMVRKLSI